MRLLLALLFAATLTAPPLKRPREVSYLIFLVAGEDRLVSVARRGLAGDTAFLAAQSMQGLCQGPTAAERKAGLTTALPPGCAVVDARFADGTLHLEMTRDWDAEGGAMMTQAIVRQITRTLAQVPGVKQVWFYSDGKRQEYIILKMQAAVEPFGGSPPSLWRTSL